MFAGAFRSTGSEVSFRNRASNCILITIAVICVCVLVTCGVMIVREYVLSIGYSQAHCTVTNVTIGREYKCQYCDNKKKPQGKDKGKCSESSFPCAQVKVSYTKNGYKLHGVLHPDSIQAIGKYAKCSYIICLKTLQENRQKVEAYRREWLRRVGHNMTCFYNLENHGTLISTKKHTKNEVIHSMLWPSVIILICGAIFLKLEMDRRRLTCCGQQDDFIDSKSNPKGRTCNGRNDQLPEEAAVRTGGAAGGNLHRSLEHLSNYTPNKTDYRSTGNSSKSLSCLDHLGVNGHSSKNGSKQPLLRPVAAAAQIQASCSDTGQVKSKVLKSSSDQSQCLIPEIKIDEFESCESQKNHHETPV